MKDFNMMWYNASAYEEDVFENDPTENMTEEQLMAYLDEQEDRARIQSGRFFAQVC